jgi:hypothetical protein
MIDQHLQGESRGITEVISYILLFGMILIVATTATTIGFGQISTQQQLEQVSAVENGFEILDRDIETIQRYGDPKKQTPLNIQTGSVGYASTQTNITIGERDGGSFTESSTSISTTPIIYKTQDREIVYEAGLVFSNDLNGNTLSRRSTNAVIGSNRATVPLVVVNPTDTTTGLSPSGVVVIESTYVSDPLSTQERTISTDGDPIWIEIESQQPAGWVNQLEKEGFTDIDRTGDTVQAKLSDGTNTPTTATLSTTIIQTDISS